jgi:hypothetical protein
MPTDEQKHLKGLLPVESLIQFYVTLSGLPEAVAPLLPILRSYEDMGAITKAERARLELDLILSALPADWKLKLAELKKQVWEEQRKPSED